MIDLNTLFSQLYLNKDKKSESGLLKAKLLHIHNITGEGTTGYISQQLWEAAEREEIEILPVITKFMSHGSRPYKQKNCIKSSLYVDKTPLNIILRRVRKVGIHQLNYLTETIKACGMTALLFDTAKSIRSFEIVIQHLLQIYPYISLEGYNLDSIKNKMGRKLVVLAEFFDLHDCIMLYGGKPDGFGLTISIIDPVGSQNQHQLLIKSFVNILFSKQRESIFVADGTEIRGEPAPNFVQTVVNKFMEYALTYCVNNKNITVAKHPIITAVKHHVIDDIDYNREIYSATLATTATPVKTPDPYTWKRTNETTINTDEMRSAANRNKSQAYWKYITSNNITTRPYTVRG